MTDERTRLIRLLNEIFDWNFNPNVVDMVDTTRLSDCLLSNGVTIQRWIPVAERLPEDLEDVLTCDKYGYCHVFRHHHDYSHPFNISKHDLRYNPVTHWMPLPTPPKEE